MTYRTKALTQLIIDQLKPSEVEVEPKEFKMSIFFECHPLKFEDVLEFDEINTAARDALAAM